MEKRGDEVHMNETEASGGSKEGVVRWMLLVGTLLAIVFLSIIWMTGALTQGNVEEEATISGIAASTDETSGDDTDSIVGIEEDNPMTDQSSMEDGLEVIEN